MIIITGGAGFIGSNIVAALEKNGYKDLVVADYLGSDEKWKNIAKRELCAVVSPDKMLSYMEDHAKEIEAVIHMGAISATTETDADLIIHTNFTLSQQIWDFCSKHQCQFIYASSAATYGDGSLGFDDNSSLEHLNALRPLNAYGWSKALFDRKVARDIKEGRPQPLQYAGLKFFNVYGPNEYHKGGQKSVVAHIFPQVKKNETVQLFKSYNPNYKDGWQLRDFVWVGDCVNVILWLLKHPNVNGLFNVGTGQARSFYDLAKASFQALGLTEKIAFKDMPEALKGKYQYYTQADLTKLRSVGYTAPMTSLEDGIREYVCSYLNEEDPYV
jgi:ADP-L-glycero-D-manno-heptose 6-epimerase